MSIEGWYYLHENGSMIYKRELDGGTAADIRESPFALAMWPLDPTDRAGAWRIVVEGLAAGAKRERIMEMAEKWGCTAADAQHYAEYIGAILQMDGNQWCATRKDFTDLQESPAGFGDNPVDAFAALAKELGYRPAKMWGSEFSVLCGAAKGVPQ